MCVTDYNKCYEFYSTYFNFFPSEVSLTRITISPPISPPKSKGERLTPVGLPFHSWFTKMVSTTPSFSD